MHADNDNELPRTRAEAKGKGLKQYFTGKPCKHGHVAPRRVDDCKCMECARIKSKKWRKDNPERLREQTEKWRAENPERKLENDRKWRLNNPEKARATRKKWRDANPERADEMTRDWERRNPERKRSTGARSDKKRRSTPRGKIDNAMSCAIWKSLKGAKGGRSWEALVGYTVSDLMAHLEQQFLPGMSWSNYGKWHVDHRVPKSAFNYSSPEDIDFARAWALSNLQPLWAVDNIKKKDRLDEPFQPSLSLFGGPPSANDNTTTTTTTKEKKHG